MLSVNLVLLPLDLILDLQSSIIWSFFRVWSFCLKSLLSSVFLPFPCSSKCFAIWFVKSESVWYFVYEMKIDLCVPLCLCVCFDSVYMYQRSVYIYDELVTYWSLQKLDFAQVCFPYAFNALVHMSISPMHSEAHLYVWSTICCSRCLFSWSLYKRRSRNVTNNWARCQLSWGD